MNPRTMTARTSSGCFLGGIAGLLMPIALHAQPLHFNDSSAWSEEHWRFEGLEAQHLLFTITVQGDTAIQGQLYKRLRRQGTATIAPLLGDPPPPPVTLAIDAYAGALRADSAEGRWWVVLPGEGDPRLLYDFNLAVGDTLSGTYGDCAAAPIVTSIDASWFNGRAHRRFVLSGGRYLIEGIGASSGLFGYLCQLFEEYGCLQAYTQGDAHWAVLGCGPLTTAMPDDPRDGKAARAFPNPTAGSVTVPGLRPGQRAAVHDIAGRCLATVPVDGHGSIDLGMLPAGTYLLLPLTASGRQAPLRVVKQ